MAISQKQKALTIFDLDSGSSSALFIQPVIYEVGQNIPARTQRDRDR